MLALASCVAYERDDANLEEIAASLQARVGGQLSFPEAVALAMRQNPELAALEAASRAAGIDVPTTELQGQWDGFEEMVAVMVDPVALLRRGPRGAAVTLAEVRGAEALAALAEARWRIVAKIAELYAVTTALRGLEAPQPAVDPEPFVRAGLASPAAAAQVRAAAANAEAERLALDVERVTLVAELRQLLGLPPTTDLEFVPIDGDFPPLPPAEDAAVLQRPDLALALARYRVADAEFRRAVADQYPSLMLGPQIPLRGGPLDAMAVLRLPLGASSLARAAQERRTAARATLVAAFLAASNAASVADSTHAAAEQRAVAMSASAVASAAALAAAKTGLQVEVDAFQRLAEAAPMAVRDAVELRGALVAAARARVQRAVAFGWPSAEVRR